MRALVFLSAAFLSLSSCTPEPEPCLTVEHEDYYAYEVVVKDCSEESDDVLVDWGSGWIDVIDAGASVSYKYDAPGTYVISATARNKKTEMSESETIELFGFGHAFEGQYSVSEVLLNNSCDPMDSLKLYSAQITSDDELVYIANFANIFELVELKAFDEKNFIVGVLPGQYSREPKSFNLYMNCNDGSGKDNIAEDGTITVRYCAVHNGIFPCEYEAIITMTPK